MSHTPSQTAGIIVAPVAQGPSVPQAVRSFAARRLPAILETVRPGGAYARYSILAFDPVETFVFRRGDEGSPIEALFRRSAELPRLAPPTVEAPAFAGGWIGFFTYEAGLRTERIADRIDHADTTLARFHLYDYAAVYDHAQGAWLAVAIEWPAGMKPDRTPAGARVGRIGDLLAAARVAEQAQQPCGTEPAEHPAESGRVARTQPHAVTTSLPRAVYFEHVARLLREIRDGNVYQVNLTQRLTTRTDATPLELYLRLRDTNPASHAALLPWSPAVISSSPELLLDVRDRRVVTRPIKGTRARTGDAGDDAARRVDLESSEKDRAELNMIIDLLRNDLGRVCEAGSIRVEERGRIEAHPTVFHRVATVSGRLSTDATWADLLTATLPGGSVTGAPKIAAMKLIHELEPVPRLAYCGAIGYIGLNGDLSFNLAIRTMIQDGETVHVHAGGGIVADSDPDDEWDECRAKARGMLEALGVEWEGKGEWRMPNSE